jgi:hypothetical protein
VQFAPLAGAFSPRLSQKCPRERYAPQQSAKAFAAGMPARFLLPPRQREMRMKNWNAMIWLAALALQPLGAVAADEASTKATPSDQAPSAVGTLTVQWTVSGRRDPSDCGGFGVERFVLSARSVSSAPSDEEQGEAPCDAFQISMDLAPGSYTGEATLVDRLDRPLTLALPLEQVDIVAGREVVKSVDFAVGAFL